MAHLRPLVLLSALALAAGACSPDAAPSTTAPTAPPPGATTAPPATPAPTTTTTSAAPRPTRPPVTFVPVTIPPAHADVIVEGNAPKYLARSIADLYSWLADQRNSRFDIPESLAAHLAGAELAVVPQVSATMTATELSTGASIGIVHIEDDVLVAVDDGAGWEMVGFAPTGATAWFGEEPLFLLVLGSDARPGQNQRTLRADSIHILALSPTGDAGTIVGFPRDAFISREIIRAANETVGLPQSRLPGGTKFTHVMAGRGPEIMLATARELTGLPISGYVVTGFRGFENLIDDFGGLTITLDRRVRTGNEFPDYRVGEQWLTGIRTLTLARTRKTLPGGDFDRSLNQGLVILAAMAQAQLVGIDALPDLLNILLEHTWTNLSAADLTRFGASGLLLDPARLENIVLPGRIGNIGGASVVILDEDELHRIIADVADDGVLESGP